jgi:hypothetical protein
LSYDAEVNPEKKIIGSIEPPTGLKERMYDLLEEYGDAYFDKANNPEDPQEEIHLIQIMTKAFQDALTEYRNYIKSE